MPDAELKYILYLYVCTLEIYHKHIFTLAIAPRTRYQIFTLARYKISTPARYNIYYISRY